MGGKPKPANLDHATTARDGLVLVIALWFTPASWGAAEGVVPVYRVRCHLSHSDRIGIDYAVDLVTPVDRLPDGMTPTHKREFRRAVHLVLKDHFQAVVAPVHVSRVEWDQGYEVRKNENRFEMPRPDVRGDLVYRDKS